MLSEAKGIDRKMSNVWRRFKAEMNKYLLEVRCYYPDQIVGIVVLFILFFGFFSMSSVNMRQDSAFYIGFVYWFYASGIIANSSASISEEKQSGTFEQLLIKPTGLSSILFYRSICWLMLQTFEIVIIILTIRFVFRIEIGFSIAILPVFIVTMIGLVGISYLLSALTLVFTKTASFESILSYILLFFTGVISGVDSVKNFAYYVLPLSQGIGLSRQLIHGQIPKVTSIVILVLNSAAYFLIGGILFKVVMSKAKTKGIGQEY